MVRPIKSTKIQRFFKYMGLTVMGFGIMGYHYTVHPPEKFKKKEYRQIVERNRMIWDNRGISPMAFGGSNKNEGPFGPPTNG